MAGRRRIACLEMILREGFAASFLHGVVAGRFALVGCVANMKKHHVCIAGLGYIGLPLAVVIAERRGGVYGYDVNPRRAAALNRGECPIDEPGLADRLRAVIESGALKVGHAPEPADHFIVAVPTPVGAGHEPDMAYVEAASRAMAACASKESTFIIESTSPVGTTERARDQVRALRPDLFDGTAGPYFCYCPERIIPGAMMREIVENDRVMGGLDAEGTRRGAALYESFCKGRILQTTARAAEMCKLAENAFRDVNIAFANELSMVCAQAGVDAWEVIRIANHHPRVNILQPGVGVGGHCIAVDPWFIIKAWPQEARLMEAARGVNTQKTDWTIRRIEERVATLPAGSKIACFGLAYKPNIGDMRESPALEIAHHLTQAFPGRVVCVEPHLEAVEREELEREGLRFADSAEGEQADLIALLVPHRAFADLGASAETAPRLIAFHRA